jgi:hypothetical protein
MRGQDTQQASLFSSLSPEERVPVTHPLRAIRPYVDTALARGHPHWNNVMPGPVGPRLPRSNSSARCCCRCSTASAVSGS